MGRYIIGHQGSRQFICWLFQRCRSCQVCGAVGYVRPYQRIYWSPWWMHPHVGHCLSCHVALARIRAVAFHMTGVSESHAFFSAEFCGCPSVVRSGWPWYAPWVWSICISVTQVDSLPPDVLGLFVNGNNVGLFPFTRDLASLVGACEDCLQWRGYGLSYLLEDPWVELIRASCLVGFEASQQFQDSFCSYGELNHFLRPPVVQGISWARVSPQYIQAVMVQVQRCI